MFFYYHLNSVFYFYFLYLSTLFYSLLFACRYSVKNIVRLAEVFEDKLINIFSAEIECITGIAYY